MGRGGVKRGGIRLIAARLFLAAAVFGGFGARAVQAAGPVSDDFAGATLDGQLWTFIDPQTDSAVVTTGTHAEIVVPATADAHDVWTNGNYLPRLTQSVDDTDFEIEAKFESALTEGFQSQGILIEQDANHVVRAEFHIAGGQTKIFVATIFGQSASIKTIQPVALSLPMYLRVGRSGNGWTVRHSLDGENWTTAASFSQAMTVTGVSVFAGTGADTAHTAIVDYVFETGAAIDPEDGGLASIVVATEGSGSVVRVPDGDGYALDEVVELTAVPDTGWAFDQWGGDLGGNENPLSFAIAGDVIASARFVRALDTTPPLISGVAVVEQTSSAMITWSTDEAATSVVDYGLTGSYTDSAWDSALSTTHSLTLYGLSPGTTYHFQVLSEDESGNASASVDATFTTLPNSGPTVDVWYGDFQTFGDPGVSQRWVNVLGNVSDSDGVASLVYSLNGGPDLPLSIGPDTRRLLKPGDFNVEIATTDLLSGLNEVVITATDTYETVTVETVTVDYVTDGVWPEPVTVDWSTVTNVAEVSQVVDGRWAVVDGALRPTVMGYDRVVAVGDVGWADYEVTVPITMHELDPTGYLWPSVSPGFGISLRWPGHTAWDDAQPTWGWQPAGAGVWYDAGYDGPLTLGGEDGLSESAGARVLEYVVPYVFKMRVQTVGGAGNFYAVKVWEEGTEEPAAWDLSGMEDLSDVATGSCILIAHHMDVSFGNVTLVPTVDVEAPVISGVAALPGSGSATITWTTDEPAASGVDYGLTTAYTDSVWDDELRTSHSMQLTGLSPEATYHYQVVAEDAAGNVATSADFTFTT
ncbi:MAG: hypothetical protein PVI86_13155, partial [Phycisphaerae bacterium]